MDSALALAGGIRPVKLVCEVLGASRSNVSARLARAATWRDGRQSRQTDDAAAVEEIRRVIGDLPSYGYRRVWGILRNERVAVGLAPFNAKRIYRVMRTHGLLMQRRPIPPRPPNVDTTARWPSRAAISGGGRTALSSAATMASHCT